VENPLEGIEDTFDGADPTKIYNSVLTEGPDNTWEEFSTIAGRSVVSKRTLIFGDTYSTYSDKLYYSGMCSAPSGVAAAFVLYYNENYEPDGSGGAALLGKAYYFNDGEQVTFPGINMSNVLWIVF
jgi:hypothetical protein